MNGVKEPVQKKGRLTQEKLFTDKVEFRIIPYLRTVTVEGGK